LLSLGWAGEQQRWTVAAVAGRADAAGVAYCPACRPDGGAGRVLGAAVPPRKPVARPRHGKGTPVLVIRGQPNDNVDQDCLSSSPGQRCCWHRGLHDIVGPTMLPALGGALSVHSRW